MALSTSLYTVTFESMNVLVRVWRAVTFPLPRPGLTASAGPRSTSLPLPPLSPAARAFAKRFKQEFVSHEPLCHSHPPPWPGLSARAAPRSTCVSAAGIACRLERSCTPTATLSGHTPPRSHRCGLTGRGWGGGARCVQAGVDRCGTAPSRWDSTYRPSPWLTCRRMEHWKTVPHTPAPLTCRFSCRSTTCTTRRPTPTRGATSRQVQAWAGRCSGWATATASRSGTRRGCLLHLCSSLC